MVDFVIPTQTCWGCKHFRLDYEGDWSEFTPGSGFSMNCNRNHFHEYGASMDEKDFAGAMQQGFTCPDWEKRK